MHTSVFVFPVLIQVSKQFWDVALKGELLL